MFYKGTLKSYSPETETGIICLSGQDIELNFTLQDIPNASLTPEPGERVKCLIEDRQGQPFAKYIVRLDHKNASTEQPKHQSETDLPSDPSQLGNSSAQDEALVTNHDPLTHQQTQDLSARQTLSEGEMIVSPAQNKLNTQNTANTQTVSQHDLQATPLAQPIDQSEPLSHTATQHSQAVQEQVLKARFIHPAQRNALSSNHALSSSSDSIPHDVAVNRDLDTGLIEHFDMRPADLDVKGTIDLTKRFKTVNDPFEELYPTRSPAEKIKLAADPIDEFEQLQKQIRGHSDRLVVDHYTYNHELNQKQHSSNDAENPTEAEDIEQTFRQKIRIKQPSRKFKLQRYIPNIPPYIVLSVVSAVLLLGLSYLGFQKYVKHKAEQDARAQYYLLEQQKAIEEQSKRMSKLANKGQSN